MDGLRRSGGRRRAAGWARRSSAAVAGNPDTRLAGALDRDGAEVLGADSGVVSGLGENGIAITSDPLPLFAAADAVLDFTVRLTPVSPMPNSPPRRGLSMSSARPASALIMTKKSAPPRAMPVSSNPAI